MITTGEAAAGSFTSAVKERADPLFKADRTNHLMS
jgi:hypothetical protein